MLNICTKSIARSGINKRLHAKLGTNMAMQKRNLIEIPGFAVVGAAIFVATRYRISQPHQMIVKTGFGISDIDVSKQTIQWPFQTYQFINLVPKNYKFDLNGMSSEKLGFVLPGVFTIGPKKDEESIKKYSQFMNEINNQKTEGGHSDQETIIKGILEGETRLESARMTMDEIFNDRQAFKNKVIDNIQTELDKFGLVIYNANINELADAPGSNYFLSQSLKIKTGVENKAKIDVAENTKLGDIGQKEREADTRQRTAQLEAETILVENIRAQEIEKSKADLAVIKAEAFRKTEIAKIEATNAAKIKEIELQKELENKRIGTETEKLRASGLTKTQVDAEALKLSSDAALYAKQQEANGIVAVYDAQSTGIRNLVASFGNNTNALIQYLMLDKGLYESLAKANAQAIQGLNPKITVWNTSGNTQDPIANVLKMIPPVLTTIHDQTGIKFADGPINLGNPTETLELKPAETTQTDVKTLNPEPTVIATNTKPVVTKPVDTKPIDSKQVDVKK